VIKYKSNPQHLQRVGRRDRTKKERKEEREKEKERKKKERKKFKE